MVDYFAHESSYIDQGAQVGKGTKIWHFCESQKSLKQRSRSFIDIVDIKEKAIDPKIEMATANLDEMRNRGYWLSDTVIEVAKKLAKEQ